MTTDTDPDTARLERVDGVEATVARVTDGDTLRLRDGRRVRLLQIDAPEAESECYGRAATGALKRLAPPGSTVLLARDPSLDNRDDYGRLLRYVVADGAVVNVELVREGAAVAYFFHRERGMLADELLAETKDARRVRRGLWGACRGAKLDPNRGSLTGPA